MKKKLLFFLVPLVVVIAIAGYLAGGLFGNVSKVSREIGDSRIYDPAEIESAMDLAQEYFRKNYEGCQLLTLTYDETYSEKFAGDWAEQYGAEQAIVLLSDFVTGRNSGAFNPNDYYPNWQWVLTRNAGEPWQLRTSGYG